LIGAGGMRSRCARMWMVAVRRFDLPRRLRPCAAVFTQFCTAPCTSRPGFAGQRGVWPLQNGRILQLKIDFVSALQICRSANARGSVIRHSEIRHSNRRVFQQPIFEQDVLDRRRPQ
jgi:hypothetical protein